MYLVSACLIGANCKYSGGNNANKKVMEFLRHKEFLAICPEEMGGLPTPRVPAEIQGEYVVNKEGQDVTLAFKRGADLVIKLLASNDVEGAILKERSPSCGVNKIYNGHFDGTLIQGQGLTARALTSHGIKCLSEEDL